MFSPTVCYFPVAFLQKCGGETRREPSQDPAGSSERACVSRGAEGDVVDSVCKPVCPLGGFVIKDYPPGVSPGVLIQVLPCLPSLMNS